jgi:ligand-binding SRPBCC domain-containing protein
MFTLNMKTGSSVFAQGHNFIDACLKAENPVNWREVKSYQENGGNETVFAR